MQIELSLFAELGADYSANDLGYLLHKHPGHLHEREAGHGTARLFFPEASEHKSRAVLHLDVDPVALVRGSGEQTEGLLAEYVNDRPYAANSLLSVALGRTLGQTMAGRSQERQDLADRALSFEARVVPVAVSGGLPVIEALFAPLGYRIEATEIDANGRRSLFDLRLSTTARLRDVLQHLYVLIPVLDNAKHYWVDKREVDKLLAKGGDWLAEHPARELIARRSLDYKRSLVHLALERLSEGVAEEEEDEAPAAIPVEEELDPAPRLHDARLDAVRDVIREAGARTVLDLGCGEGKLIQRLLKLRGIDQVVGIDASLRTLEIAARRLRLDEGGERLRQRVQLRLGSLTYGDRRWRGFEAAALVEVIEHLDPQRLPALELSVFASARPKLVVVTTPNREYNLLFPTLPAGAMRHGDHRFEWTRAEFEAWAGRVAQSHGYRVALHPLGPEDPAHGALSQMAVFREGVAA